MYVPAPVFSASANILLTLFKVSLKYASGSCRKKIDMHHGSKNVLLVLALLAFIDCVLVPQAENGGLCICESFDHGIVKSIKGRG